jgi:hypothetical protein
MRPRVTGIEAKYGPSAILGIAVQLEQLPGFPGAGNPVVLAAEMSLDLLAAGKGPPKDRTTVSSLSSTSLPFHHESQGISSGEIFPSGYGQDAIRRLGYP